MTHRVQIPNVMRLSSPYVQTPAEVLGVKTGLEMGHATMAAQGPPSMHVPSVQIAPIAGNGRPTCYPAAATALPVKHQTFAPMVNVSVSRTAPDESVGMMAVAVPAEIVR